MKYVIIIPDGCADESQTELDGKTPLEAANTPAMDQIASHGIVGRANHTPAHLPALLQGASLANASLLRRRRKTPATGQPIITVDGTH